MQFLLVGFQMPSWFDLKTLDMYGPEDKEGIEKATANIQYLIQTEISAGIPANRILVGGFSQGGALALYAGLTSTHTLGGIIGLSCWLPLHKSFPAARKTDDTLPIFQCHGEADPVLPFKFGQLSHFSLKTFMKNAQFNSYPGLSHSSSPDEMNDVKVRDPGRARRRKTHPAASLTSVAVLANRFGFSFTGIHREICSTTVKCI